MIDIAVAVIGILGSISLAAMLRSPSERLRRSIEADFTFVRELPDGFEKKRAMALIEARLKDWNDNAAHPRLATYRSVTNALVALACTFGAAAIAIAVLTINESDPEWDITDTSSTAVWVLVLSALAVAISIVAVGYNRRAWTKSEKVDAAAHEVTLSKVTPPPDPPGPSAGA